MVTISRVCRALDLVVLDRVVGPGHRQAAGDEHDGVERAQRDVQLGRDARLERLRIQPAVDRVAQEQAGEQQHLGAEEEPHPQADRVVLHLDVVEVMRQVRMVPGRVRRRFGALMSQTTTCSTFSPFFW